MYLYNGVELPDYTVVYSNYADYVQVENHLYAFMTVEDSVTFLYVGNENAIYRPSDTSFADGIIFASTKYKFILSGGEWIIQPKQSSWYRLSLSTVFWSNHNIKDVSGNVFFTGTDPVGSNAPTGTLEIKSSQILDDSASFVVSVFDLASTESIYSIKAVLSSYGTEVKSTVTDAFAGTSNEMLLTVANLEPETAYDISFILQKNGTDTTITATTSFTTLAGSAAGEGETPDYSGQLGEIQQGIGDIQTSVDGVGETLEGVQDTLTETKEEITSLPQKIATAISDGVKGLFIPSQEDLTAIRDKYEDMLSEKLGFVWQAYDLLTGFVGDLQTNLESGEAYEFTFPGVKLPMQGQEFVLVAETPVSLENDLMDVLRPVLGTIVSIICVSAFVNMAHDYVLAIISGVSAYQFERRKEE